MRAALSVARRAISRALAITPAATATRAAVAEGNLTILAGASRAASTYATGFAGSAAFAPAALRGATIFSTIAAAAGAGAAYVAYENVPVAEAKAASPKAPSMFKEVTLYQYDVCPFCNKVKAYLDYHNIPYDVVEVHPLFKNELKFSEYKKVPVLKVDGEQLNDSSHIIATLDKRMFPKGKGGWGAKAAEEKEAKWAGWVDSRFVHVLTPNIYRTWEEAFKSFDYITERGNFNWAERQTARWTGALAMFYISKYSLKKRHGIEDERAELYKCVDDFIANGVGKAAFCGGSEPNKADLAVFGVLRAVKTFDTFMDVMDNTSAAGWYKRMEAVVGPATRTDGLTN